MKDGMKGGKMHEQPKAHPQKNGNWNGQASRGATGEKWEGLGKECRGEAAKRGFGKS